MNNNWIPSGAAHLTWVRAMREHAQRMERAEGRNAEQGQDETTNSQEVDQLTSR